MHAALSVPARLPLLCSTSALLTSTAAHTACLPSACPAPPFQAFLNKFLRNESDDGEVQFAVELLQELDAAGDTEGVQALVESYLPK